MRRYWKVVTTDGGKDEWRSGDAWWRVASELRSGWVAVGQLWLALAGRTQTTPLALQPLVRAGLLARTRGGAPHSANRPPLTKAKQNLRMQQPSPPCCACSASLRSFSAPCATVPRLPRALLRGRSVLPWRCAWVVLVAELGAWV